MISDVFLSIKENFGKVCLEYIARIKQTAVKVESGMINW